MRRIGIGFQPQAVFTLVDLLGIIPVDHVCGVPVRILLGKAADGWVVVSRSQVVIAGFGVQVFAAVAEGVGVQGVGVFLVAEGVVVIFFVNGAVEVGGGDNVAVGVEEVVFGFVRTRPADEVDAAQIIVGDGAVLDFGHYVATVEKVGCPEVVHPLGCPDSLGVVGICFILYDASYFLYFSIILSKILPCLIQAKQICTSNIVWIIILQIIIFPATDFTYFECAWRFFA